MAHEQSIALQQQSLEAELMGVQRRGRGARLLRRLPVASLLILCLMVIVGIAAPLVGVLLAAALRPSFRNVLIIIIGWTWAGFARIIRAEVLGVRERDFITACRSVGAGWPRVVFRHIAPNIANTAVVLATLNV